MSDAEMIDACAQAEKKWILCFSLLFSEIIQFICGSPTACVVANSRFSLISASFGNGVILELNGGTFVFLIRQILPEDIVETCNWPAYTLPNREFAQYNTTIMVVCH